MSFPDEATPQQIIEFPEYFDRDSVDGSVNTLVTSVYKTSTESKLSNNFKIMAFAPADLKIVLKL
jgi:hypothetical protein